MADGKKSFVLYCDLIHTIELLDDTTTGKLMKHLLRYVNDLDPQTDDLLLKLAFEPIKRQLKRDLQDWEVIKKDRSIAGRLGNIKRWNLDLYEKIVSEEISISEAEIIAKDRIATKKSHRVANVAVNVTVNDTVTVNVTEIGADESTKKFYDMLVPEIVQVWLRENPQYTSHQTIDYHAALKIAYNIAQIKHWKKADVVETKKDECVESWKKIAKFIMSSNWFSKMTLDSIASDKIWQKIVVEMQAGKSGVNGTTPHEEERQRLLKEYEANRK